MAHTKPTPKNETLIRSLTLTLETEKILHSLSQDATDYIGRKASGSAILRALLRYADQQGTNWTRETLFPLIEHELESGMVWGKKKKPFCKRAVVMS